MRITCPQCGDRDRREFHYRGDAVLMNRPTDADAATMHRYLHLRDNPAGAHRELWSHEHGCRAWLVITRDTATHVIESVELARDACRGGEA